MASQQEFSGNHLVRRFSRLALGIALVLSACDEQRRIIEPFVPSGNRVVLIEEFTGKGCTNCPKGSRELENLLLQFPNNLVVVSIHAGFFADPMIFPLGQYDLRTDEGEFLYDYLGPNLGYPAGVVNRTPVSGEMQLGLNQWASAIIAQIQQEPDVDLVVSTTYQADTRLLQVTASGIGKALVTGDIRLSVMLTESGIIDAQDDAEAVPNIVPDYNHKHVLREMLTPVTGAPLENPITVGKTFTNTYSIILPENWAADKINVIAFVTAINGTSFPVLQAASARLQG